VRRYEAGSGSGTAYATDIEPRRSSFSSASITTGTVDTTSSPAPKYGPMQR
jgi:hypothetical protein